MERSAIPLEKAGDRDAVDVHAVNEQAYIRLHRKSRYLANHKVILTKNYGSATICSLRGD
jgi:hypothetical protein